MESSSSWRASLQFSDTEAQEGLLGRLILERIHKLLESNQPSSSLSTDFVHRVLVLILPDLHELFCKDSE